MGDIKEMTLAVLRMDEGARANDNRLIWLVHKACGLPTDLEEIAKEGEFTMGSITRYRRMYQAEFPELRPEAEITARRRAKQREMEEEMRDEKKRY